jgi:Fe-S-cluster-containing hydrogenase component 2
MQSAYSTVANGYNCLIACPSGCVFVGSAISVVLSKSQAAVRLTDANQRPKHHVIIYPDCSTERTPLPEKYLSSRLVAS